MIEEPIYRDFCMEFFTTIDFEEHTEHSHCQREITFWLGGQYLECSLSELAW